MSGSSGEIGIGLIGCKHWGPYHARAFNQLPRGRLCVMADRDVACLETVARQFPAAQTTAEYDTVLHHPEVDAVVIATPTDTHFSLARAALLAGKDVLVERPITHTAAEARQLIDLAERNGRVLMCAHIFMYNPGIGKLRQYVEEETLGRICYMGATRTNLDPLRRDINVLYDLGTDDVSVFHYLLGARPREAMAWGECYLQRDVEDTVFACLEFANQTLCHMHVSWLNPRKERTLVVVGDKKMAVWDDTVASEAVRLYDKGVVEEPSDDSLGQFRLVLRDADVLIPKLKAEEPLRVQDEHFLDCVQTRRRPLTDGTFGRDVVASVEALQRSLRRGGGRQPVEPPHAPDPRGRAGAEDLSRPSGRGE